MQFNTKLNIGDSIWTINPPDAIIQKCIITAIQINHFDEKGSFVDYCTGVLAGDDYLIVSEKAEGKSWWRTKEELVTHLLRTLPDQPPKSKYKPIVLQPIGDKNKYITEEQAFVNKLEQQSKPPQSLSKLFNELFTNPKQHPDEEAIDEEFDRLYGEHVCTHPKAKNKTELDQLYEDLFDR